APFALGCPPEPMCLFDDRHVDGLQHRLRHQFLEHDPGYAHTLITATQVVPQAAKRPTNAADTGMVVNGHRSVPGARASASKERGTGAELRLTRPLCIERKDSLVLQIVLLGDVCRVVIPQLDELPDEPSLRRRLASGLHAPPVLSPVHISPGIARM